MTFSDLVPSREFAGVSKTGCEPWRMKFCCSVFCHRPIHKQMCLSQHAGRDGTAGGNLCRRRGHAIAFRVLGALPAGSERVFTRSILFR
jgi:hypothetical protein